MERDRVPVATHLVYEGYLAEALTITRAVRERYDGIRRNPWDEVECGHHYMRSLASYGLAGRLAGMNTTCPTAGLPSGPG